MHVIAFVVHAVGVVVVVFVAAFPQPISVFGGVLFTPPVCDSKLRWLSLPAGSHRRGNTQIRNARDLASSTKTRKSFATNFW